ncbi:hypothetical protein Y032_0009g580 [Ancylostoma ceylanicum]|uniref:Cystatin domain-containing protein n=1 Tax=Ancylostoma ceylanicum TaxID=53326 RepID=A0A016VIU6_9BILA|nr:hypothetical protein Y032_0009g580 [Ancylostoma ceylanicum]
MRTLIAVLALCALTYTKNCPKMIKKITQRKIDNVNTVAFVTVTNATEKGKKKVYDLLYETYFDVNDKPAPRQWSVRRTITIECDRVKLRVGDDYFLGCKSENTDCKFVRPYGDLTTTENKLLKLQ